MVRSALISGILGILLVLAPLDPVHADSPCGLFEMEVQCGDSSILPPKKGGGPGSGGGGQDSLTPVRPVVDEICDISPVTMAPEYCWFPDVDDPRPDHMPIEKVPYPVVISEVKSFLTTTGEIGIQPSENQHVVNMTGVFWSTAERHVVQAPILGRVFQVRFTPINYHFDFGDGSAPIDSPAPGAPYPDKTITHVYQQPGEYITTLTVTWTGEFSINGSPFQLIGGHLDTSVQSPPQVVREYHIVHVYPDS